MAEHFTTEAKMTKIHSCNWEVGSLNRFGKFIIHFVTRLSLDRSWLLVVDPGFWKRKFQYQTMKLRPRISPASRLANQPNWTETIEKKVSNGCFHGRNWIITTGPPLANNQSECAGNPAHCSYSRSRYYSISYFGFYPLTFNPSIHSIHSTHLSIYLH